MKVKLPAVPFSLSKHGLRHGKFFNPVLQKCEPYRFIRLANVLPLETLQSFSGGPNCFEPESHFKSLVSDIVTILDERFFGKPDLEAIGTTFKDRSLLDNLKKKRNINVEMIDPIKDLYPSFDPKKNGPETIQFFLDDSLPSFKLNQDKKYDLVVSRHMIEHSYKLDDFVRTMINLMKEDGIFVLEFPDTLRSIKSGDCSVYWEEHTYYFCIESLVSYLEFCFGLKCIFRRKFSIGAEDIGVAIFARSMEINPERNSHNYGYAESVKTKVLSVGDFLDAFPQKLMQYKTNINCNIRSYRESGFEVYLFGLGHLALSFFHMMSLHDIIDGFIDDDKTVQGRMYTDSHELEVFDSEVLGKQDKDFVVILGINSVHHESIEGRLLRLNDELVIKSIFPVLQNFVGYQDD